jgi:hypothetical protein
MVFAINPCVILGTTVPIGTKNDRTWHKPLQPEAYPVRRTRAGVFSCWTHYLGVGEEIP